MGATSPRNKVHKERDPERKPSIVSRSLTERVYSSNSDHATATALSTRARVLPGKTKGYRPLSITVSPGVRREGGYKNEAVLLAGTLGRGRNKAKQYRIAVPRALSEPVLGKRRPSERHARAPTFGRFRDSIPKSIVRTVPSTSESVDGAFTSSHQQQERSLSVELPKSGRTENHGSRPRKSLPLSVNTPAPPAVPLDLSQILLENERGRYELVPGVGFVRNEESYAPQTLAYSTRSPRIIEDRAFRLKWYMDKSWLIAAPELKWLQFLDGFYVCVGSDKAFPIHASAISGVSYNACIGRFFLHSNPNVRPDLHLDEAIFEVDGGEETSQRLRSLFEGRFDGMVVGRGDIDFFIQKEEEFIDIHRRSLCPHEEIMDDAGGSLPFEVADDKDDEIRLTPLGCNETPQPLQAVVEADRQDLRAYGLGGITVANHDQEVQDINRSPYLNSSPDIICLRSNLPYRQNVEDYRKKEMVEEVGATLRTKNPRLRRVQRSVKPLIGADASPKTAKNRQESQTLGPRAPEKTLAESVLPAEADASMIMNASQLAIKPSYIDASARATQSPANFQSVGDMSWSASNRVYYRSGERVKVHDLVIRIRDRAVIVQGKDKFDLFDIYDGPFRISELPPSIHVCNVFTDDEKSEDAAALETTKEPDHEKIKAMQVKQVKLLFPDGSKAKPWTRLGRLRPVYDIAPDAPMDAPARYLYYHRQRREGVHSSNKYGKEARTANYQGVCRIQKGTYVKVQYVVSQGSEGGNQFEVEKLRGKRIDRCLRADFPDERMEDPAIKRYIREGGKVNASEVLVTRYLVHWAGWPSEDDTWERAQDNIPEEFIVEYASNCGDEAHIPESPLKKKRKISGSRRSSKT